MAEDESARIEAAATCISCAAPAKVNLHLGIHTGRDERGYHRADSVMAALDLSDEVRVRRAPAGAGLTVSVEPALDVPSERTLVARVALRLAEELGQAPDLDIHVVRRIPDKSGLGSSSTDAAAVLRALAELWGIEARDDRVVSIARQAGADVAFFLEPRPSWLDGVGDCLRETYPALGGLPVALVRPAGGVSTVEAYREFDCLPEQAANPEAICSVLRTGAVTAEILAPLLFNNLQGAAERLQPAVGEVRAWLEAQPGVVGVLMCGSGSCVFALCEDDAAAEAIATSAAARTWWSRAAHLL